MIETSAVVMLARLGKTYRRRVSGARGLERLKRLFVPQYEDVPAVTDLDLSISKGECVALIGKNGAGKSTAIKLMLGVLVPDAGTVETLGVIPYRQRQHLAFKVGVVFGQRSQLLWDIPPRNTFKLMKDLYRIDDAVYREMHAKVSELLDLAPLLDVPVRSLSLGQRVRCELAAAVLHAPSLLILDEPTIGLDVSVKERIRELVRMLVRRYQTTVVLASHDFNDIKALCDRTIVLDSGRIVFDGTLSAFRSRFAGERTIVVELESGLSLALRERLAAELAGLHARVDWPHERQARVRCGEHVSQARVLTVLIERLPVQELSLHEADMESLVASIYEGRAAGGPEHARV
jgi:ABC-2 type transport system ATP-binding protein